MREKETERDSRELAQRIKNSNSMQFLVSVSSGELSVYPSMCSVSIYIFSQK